MKEKYDIDFVVTWVDGNDEKWKKEKEKYAVNESKEKNKSDSRDVRYRDLGLLKYCSMGPQNIFYNMGAYSNMVRHK